MIRLANKFDQESVFTLLKNLNKECAIPQFINCGDKDFIEMWASICAGQGLVLIEEKNKKAIGVVMGIITPSVWSKSIRGLYEIAWYVLPEYRSTPTAYRLMSAYIKEAKNYKEKGLVQFLTISKMVNKFDRQFAKFGFTKTDENWIL